MFEIVAVVSIVFAAAFTQGLAGFGFAFMSLPLISLFVDFKTSVITLVLLAQALNLLIMWQHGQRPAWDRIIPLTLATLPGIPVGVHLLRVMPVAVLQGTLGVMLVAYSLYQWFARPVPREIGRFWVLVTGFVAGCLGGALNSQGPPILVYVSLQPWNKDRVKATMVGFFFLSGLFVLGFQAWQGLVTAETLRLSGWCLPGLIVGATLGRALYVRIGEGGYRRIFTALVCALGVLMIVKSLGGA
ncbi:hypothetical protein GGQ74_001087 [Desulfobaculum xiamenense]|uniref:Probable membrane transporter protein n=1 Tax=Desulfobaculum xiamenense TaxID=995050 RepID=A0A846QK00_9BACT|nr:sulfite exporter TauE/SafE family protein [Desulfobaculum xiamenense]NJB67447.1 hypothetical protein [Desulfobaculum xiamenense]